MRRMRRTASSTARDRHHAALHEVRQALGERAADHLHVHARGERLARGLGLVRGEVPCFRSSSTDVAVAPPRTRRTPTPPRSTLVSVKRLAVAGVPSMSLKALISVPTPRRRPRAERREVGRRAGRARSRPSCCSPAGLGRRTATQCLGAVAITPVGLRVGRRPGTRGHARVRYAAPSQGSSPAPSAIAAPARVARDVHHRRERPLEPDRARASRRGRAAVASASAGSKLARLAPSGIGKIVR